MEKALRKAGLYGFVVGCFIAFLYYPDVITVQVPGGYTLNTIPLREYLFKALRMAIKFSLAAMIAVAVVHFYRSLPTGEFEVKRFTLGVLKSFFIGLVLFLALFSLIGFIFQ